MSNRYSFGRFEVLPAVRQVRVDGIPAALGARAFDVLLCLIERRDRVVSKNELMELVWPGVMVEENNLSVHIFALRKLFGAASVVTVAGRGFRLGVEISEVSGTVPLESASSTATAVPTEALNVTPAARTGKDRLTRATDIDLALPDKPSIAVLPFVNLSGIPEQEYFTDGITGEIITELSRFHSLFVIARNSSFIYKGSAFDVRVIGKDLGVRYVLEGSIRRSGDRIRVTAQLIDALNGNHLWAEKYDRVLEDIFAVQEDVTQCIVGAIAPQIHTEEQVKARRRRPQSLSAHELALRASADADEAHRQSHQGLRQRALVQARQALAVDADNVLALEVVGWMQFLYYYFPHEPSDDLIAATSEGVGAAARLIAIDPSGSRGYMLMGLLQCGLRRWDEALAHSRHAVELNVNDLSALRQLAYIELVDGQSAISLDHLCQVARLGPRDPYLYLTLSMQAAACFQLRSYSTGMAYAHRAVSEAPASPIPYVNQVLVAAGAGDLETARAAHDAVQRLAPNFAGERLSGESPYRHPADRERVTLAWRIAAGLEPASAVDRLG